MRLIPLAALFALSVTNIALADSDQAIRTALQGLQPGLSIENISPSPVTGLYQVQLTSGQVLYASLDGKYLMQGNLFELRNGKPVNLTEKAWGSVVLRRLKEVPEALQVVFPAKEKKTHITVFSDVTCPYCRKLHGDIKELNDQGIEVRYLAWPREGLNSDGYRQMVGVWCAQDRQSAFTAAINGKPIANGECENPVADLYTLGQSLGVQGTPTIFLANGERVGGYIPAPELIKLALEAGADNNKQAAQVAP